MTRQDCAVSVSCELAAQKTIKLVRKDLAGRAGLSETN